MINNNYAVDLLERKARTNKEQNKISLSIVSTEPHEAVDLTENEFKNYLSNINNAKRIGFPIFFHPVYVFFHYLPCYHVGILPRKRIGTTISNYKLLTFKNTTNKER